MAQAIISVFGLAGLLYTLRLNSKATNAAVEAVETQIASERPILQIVRLKVNKVAREGLADFLLNLDWSLVNQGKTGCWMERMCIYPAIGDDNEAVLTPWNERYASPMVAHVMPGKGWGIVTEPGPDPNSPGDSEWKFTDREEALIRDKKVVYVFGYSIYRDPGGRRWQTGFALYLRLNDEFSGEVFHPLANDDMWADVRLPNAGITKMPWYERSGLAIGKFYRALTTGKRYDEI
jgi:hypothetical protein